VSKALSDTKANLPSQANDGGKLDELDELELELELDEDDDFDEGDESDDGELDEEGVIDITPTQEQRRPRSLAERLALPSLNGASSSTRTPSTRPSSTRSLSKPHKRADQAISTALSVRGTNAPSSTSTSRHSTSTELVRREDTALAQRDILSRYLAEIRQYPLLSKEEEDELTQAYLEDQDEHAAKRLVLGNLRLVVKIAMEYRREWSNVMDLIQEGNIGLGQAVKRFDPHRGVRFGTFARYWIRALILQYILKNHHMISFANTRAGRKLFFRLEKERARLMSEFGEAPVKMLAHNLEVSEDEVKAVLNVKRPTLSLDAPKHNDEPEGGTLIDLIPSEDDDLEELLAKGDLQGLFKQQLKRFGAQLTDERERAIWDERLCATDPASLTHLGERFGVSRERARQLEKRLKERFKAFLEAELDEETLLEFEQV
jgi:RNA polymerase sigma-32 factor